jgi:hypothetical protein
LCEDEVGGVRLVRLGHEMHVLVGRRLRDFVTVDEGRSWQEQDPLLPADRSLICWRFDATVVESSLVVALVGIAKGAERSPFGRTCGLWTVRRVANRAPERQLVRTLDGSADSQASPALLVTHGVLVLASSSNATHETSVSEADGQAATKTASVGGIVALRSTDAGSSWTSARPLQPPNDLPGWSQVRQLVLGGTGGTTLLLAHAGERLYQVALGDSSASQPLLLQLPHFQLVSPAMPRNFACSFQGNSAVLAWIAHDQRSKEPSLLTPWVRPRSNVMMASGAVVGDTLALAAPAPVLRGQEVLGLSMSGNQNRRVLAWTQTTLLIGDRPAGVKLYYTELSTMSVGR